MLIRNFLLESGFDSWMGQKGRQFQRHQPDSSVHPTSLPIGFRLGIKRGRDLKLRHSFPCSSDELLNSWRYTSSSVTVVLLWSVEIVCFNRLSASAPHTPIKCNLWNAPAPSCRHITASARIFKTFVVVLSKQRTTLACKISDKTNASAFWKAY